MRGRRWLACGVVAVLATNVALAAVEVPVSVTEPLGVARSNMPVTGGIPMMSGALKDADQLVLVDAAGAPVPAQFTILTRREDGSARWVLVDFTTDLAANETKQFTLKTGPGAAHPKTPLRIRQEGDRITVDTGVVAFTVDTANFSLFESVTVGGRPVVTGSRIGLVNCALEQTTVGEDRRAETFHAPTADRRAYACRTAKPERVKWEYRGPVRATLRIDGDYITEPTKGDTVPMLSYTTRITAWAGCGAVRVQHAVRNSNPAVGFDAYIKRAALTLNLGLDAKDQGRGLDWAAGGDGAVGLLVQNKHTAGLFRGPCTYTYEEVGDGWRGKPYEPVFAQEVGGRLASVDIIPPGPQLPEKQVRGALGYTQDGIFALADLARKDSDVWFDFYTDRRDTPANEARALGFRSRLLLVAPGSWYSDTEALAMGHFGTLEDEIQTYKMWGWKGFDDEKKYPKQPHQALAFVHKEWIHDVTEDDCAEGYLIQFLRMQDQRGFFDWSEAWTGFYRGHAIERTDWGKRWTKTAPTGQRRRYGMGFGWYGPHWYDWADSRMHGCHHYGRGIFAYYCMTGEVDALEAGLDLAEQMTGNWDRGKPGQGVSLGRTFGRQFLTVLSAWLVTGDPHWKQVADHWAALYLKASNWDPEFGVYRSGMGIYNTYFLRDWVTPRAPRELPPRLTQYLKDNGISAAIGRGGGVFGKKGDQEWEIYKLPQLFELSACHLAFERYARFFNSEPMGQLIVDLARGVDRCYWSEHSKYVNGISFLGWPEKDEPFDPYKWIDDPERQKLSGYATRYTADMFARAYSITRDPKWLELAKRSWDRGSKRGYQQTEPFAGPDEVGQFAFIRGAHNNVVSECSARMFYEVPRAKGK